jgi:hypothetical protein
MRTAIDGPDELYLNGLGERPAFREAMLGLARALEWVRADGVDPLDADTDPDEQRRRLRFYLASAILWYREASRRAPLVFVAQDSGLPACTADVLRIGRTMVAAGWANDILFERRPDVSEQLLDEALLADLRRLLEPIDFVEIDRQLRRELLGLVDPIPAAAPPAEPPDAWDAILRESSDSRVADVAAALLAAAAKLGPHEIGDALDLARDLLGCRLSRTDRRVESARAVLERLGLYTSNGAAGRGRRYEVPERARSEARDVASYLRRSRVEVASNRP